MGYVRPSYKCNVISILTQWLKTTFQYKVNETPDGGLNRAFTVAGFALGSLPPVGNLNKFMFNLQYLFVHFTVSSISIAVLIRRHLLNIKWFIFILFYFYFTYCNEVVQYFHGFRIVVLRNSNHFCLFFHIHFYLLVDACSVFNNVESIAINLWSERARTSVKSDQPHMRSLKPALNKERIPTTNIHNWRFQCFTQFGLKISL